MGLFRALADRVPGPWGGSDREDADTFEYRCRDCDREFESTSPHVTTAACPACGSDDVRVREDPY